ncbi:hypothetical protein [Elongatibacter sediminis]|uniref:Zinc resistance-associated protein n=1 Tax=Elongatibacter sediminis TaxID=3119006 RepID=A0AAW9RAJ1_9GAMM
MTRLTRLSLTLCLFTLALVAAGTASARPHGDGHRGFPPSAEQQVARMSEALDLDDAQSAELLVILQHAEIEREELRANMEESFKPDICALRAQTAEEIRSVLNAEQIAQMEEHLERRAERAEKRAEKRAERRGRPGPPWLECED